MKKFYYRFPLIISIENHCCLENQRKMASYFTSIFGSNSLKTFSFWLNSIYILVWDKLITEFLKPNEKEFPSPKDLSGRIILKVTNRIFVEEFFSFFLLEYQKS